MPHPHHGGRHELGQNHLHDRRVIADIVRAAASTSGPILEIGAGSGALTIPLSRLGRPIIAVELDPGRAEHLADRTPRHVSVQASDFLAMRMPHTPGLVVGNVPFAITTPILRKLLTEGAWTTAVLVVQWEVARRRAAVGGATMLTASAWPWYDFSLLRRVPSTAFRPVPSVDGGILRIDRRRRPLVPERDRRRYERFVERMFTGRGRDVAAVLRGSGSITSDELQRWTARNRVDRRGRVGQLSAEQWADLWRTVGPRFR